MSNVGYFRGTGKSAQVQYMVKQMRSLGCSDLYIEQPKEKKRPKWNAFVDALSPGDCAVLYSFDDTFPTFNDMIFFLKYCGKAGIRLVSIMDRIDTTDELFPDRSTQDVLALVCRLFGKRDKAASIDAEPELYVSRYTTRANKRYALVVNMYKAGYKVSDIMKRTGYRGRSNIYRILEKANVERRRKTGNEQ